jgi:hypothetical protein
VPYSLVNVSALGYDLVRLPRGDQVGRVLRLALACGPEQLAALAVRHPGPCRAPHRQDAAQQPDPVTRRTRVAARGVERAVIGDPSSLDRLLRQDVLDWTWLRSGDTAVQDPDFARGCDVLADAATSAFCGRGLDEETLTGMASPFPVGALGTDGLTGHPPVDELLGALAARTEPDRAAWREAVDACRTHSTPWAPAMHRATWAVLRSDRLRVAADAQLAAVLGFREAGFDARDGAYGVWNAVSGAVQAMLVADLLPDADHRRLTAAWSLVRAAVRS